jgi:Tol biopolymer transport system component
MNAPDRLAAALADRYVIERELGAGGMATVYLAEDLRHRRKVAIKVLRPELAAALGAERFLREIETTAGLRHPHILPLYDSGDADGFLFYVMPLVEGESLRDRLDREKQLPLDDALAIAREVADALGYAHARGIVHRDIKPENILLEGGHAVVADFGIARAVSAAGGDRLTQTGMAVGTPLYMSPEQAAGESDLDGRSDLYSLGCVLYEMLAGQPPFTGPTVEAVARQHITVDAAPVTNLRPAVPPAVAGALARTLAKNPADRFSGAARFAEALVGPAPAPARARIEPFHRRRAARVAAVVGPAAAVLLVAVLLTRRAPPPVELGGRAQVTIDPGLEVGPALSPDGKLVAFTGSRGALLVRQVQGGAPVEVLRGTDGRGRWPAWLPDGQRLLFVSARGVEIVPALGGEPRLLVAGADLERGVSVAPDGRTFAFVSHDSLYAEALDGGSARLVAVGWEMHSPAWSPDGRSIAFVKGNVQYIRPVDLGNQAQSSIWVVPAAGGAPVLVSDERSLNASPAWASARTLLFVSDRGGGRDVWQVSLRGSGRPMGDALRRTTGLNPHGVAVSRDGHWLAYSAFVETSNVWSLPIPHTGAASISDARPVTEGNQIIENIGVSPDGRWVGFGSIRGGISQLFRMRLGVTGAEPQQVTSDTTGSYWVDFSPDDREVAFHRFRGERRQAFVQPVEGGSAVPVTDGSEDERSPEWSPDGRRLLLLASWSTRPALHLLTRGPDGRWSKPRPVPVVLGADTIPAGLGAWSPDGRSIACGCGEGGLVIVPVDGGPARRLPSAFSTAGWAFPQWSADGRTVYHVTEDSGRVVAVIAVPVSGGPARVVARFDDPTRPWHRFGFRVRAGRMFFTLGDRQSDIWVAEVRRP